MREAGLNGNGLLIYAIIHGYSQESDGCCYLSISSLAKRAGCSQETARATLRTLTENGFVERLEYMEGNIHRVAYRATLKIWGVQNFRQDPPKNLGDTPQKIWGNNKEYNKRENKDSVIVNAHARFVIPTLDEVSAYCRERGGIVDAQQFIDYYTANGWKVGGRIQMRDWRAAVRTWEARRKETPIPKAPRPRYESPEEHNLRVLRQMQARDGMLHTFETPDEQ